MNHQRIPRREAMGRLASWLAAPFLAAGCRTWRRPELHLATFTADVTVPMGHGMMGGAWLSKSVADPLEAVGVVLHGDRFEPVVFVSVDWCEIRNDAYRRWQEVLAKAAGTRAERVLISAVHQHDAPVADLTAERLLRAGGLQGTVCDLEFHEEAVQRVATALRRALEHAQPVTHLGLGEARVERIASNRRYLTSDGQVRFDRTSSTRNAEAQRAGEGLVDPLLKMLSFWNSEKAVAALSFYATHPMSHYGQGEVSADFPGLARRRLQSATPGVTQIYVSGCSGNVTAGKYNDGSPENRARLADRLHEAMQQAWESTTRQSIRHVSFRMEPLELAPRTTDGFDVTSLEARLEPSTPPFQQCLAALGLSWHRRVAAGYPLQIPLLDFETAALLLLPGEVYVEFQLAAQRMRPGAMVCVAGYGDGATGYIPTAGHIEEGDSNLGDWCWVAPGADERLLESMQRLLNRE